MVKSKASKRSQKSNRSNASQCADEIVQCPHLHFKSDVIDRNVLSKEQHLNLLSTPKGYRWEEASDKKEDGQGEGTENLPTHLPRRVVCSGRRMKKPEKVYVHNFLAEVWTFLTPEMIDRLKGMLMNEFGMSPQEADQLVIEQRESNIVKSSTVSLYKKPRKLKDGTVIYDSIVKMRSPTKSYCDKYPKSSIGIRNSWIKDFSDLLSEKISSYVLETMCADRTERQQEIAQTLLSRFNTVLEQKASMTNPRTKTHKAMVLVADKLSLWLDKNVKVSKETAQRLKELEEEHERKRLNDERKKREEENKRLEADKKKADEERRLAEEKKREQEEVEKRRADEEAEKKRLEEEEGRRAEEEAEKKRLEEEERKRAEEEAEKLAEGEDKKPEEEAQLSTEDQPPESETEWAKQPEESGLTEEGEQKEEPQPETIEPQPETTEPQPETEEGAEAGTEEAAKPETEEGAKPETEEAVISGEEEQKAEPEQPEEEKPPESADEAPTETGDEKPPEPTEESQPGTEEEKPPESEEAAIVEEPKEPEPIEETRENADTELPPETTEPPTAEEAEADEPAEEPQQTTDDESEKAVAAESETVEPEKSEEPPAEIPTGDERAAEEAPPAEAPVEEVKPREEPEPIDQVSSSMKEIVQSLASIIAEMEPQKSTSRQEAIKDVVGKELEKKLGDKDKEVIDEVSSKVGTWIDQVVDKAEDEYGERPTTGAPVSQRGKGPIFKLHKKKDGVDDGCFDVELISNTNAEQRIREARGKSTAPHQTVDPDEPLKPADLKEWAKWASAVTDMAQNWAEWIENTVQEAQKKGDDYKKADDVHNQKDWEQFKDKKSSDAVEWRKTKKQVDVQAEAWSKKTEHDKLTTKKTQNN